MPIVYYGTRPKLIEAQRCLSEIFGQMTRLQIDIEAHGKFDFTNATTQQLGEALRVAWLGCAFEIRTYKTANLRVLAKTTDSKGFYVNTYRINRTQADINGTCGHELIHCIDRVTPKYVFGHGDNSPNKKGNSFPYWFGSYVKKRSIEIYGGEHV